MEPFSRNQASYTDNVDGEVKWFESFQKQVKFAKNISTGIFILGDINIDMLANKDQISISRICRTMLIYRKNME